MNAGRETSATRRRSGPTDRSSSAASPFSTSAASPAGACRDSQARPAKSVSPAISSSRREVSAAKRSRVGTKARGRARRFSKIVSVEFRARSIHPAGARSVGAPIANRAFRSERNGEPRSVTRLNDAGCARHHIGYVSANRSSTRDS
jgi:hypothetical protein